jgi:Zn ribbon nucleic-acid-binding protein
MSNKIRTEEKCPKCETFLDKEFWGATNGNEDWLYVCLKCGYFIIKNEKKEE